MTEDQTAKAELVQAGEQNEHYAELAIERLLPHIDKLTELMNRSVEKEPFSVEVGELHVLQNALCLATGIVAHRNIREFLSHVE